MRRPHRASLAFTSCRPVFRRSHSHAPPASFWRQGRLDDRSSRHWWQWIRFQLGSPAHFFPEPSITSSAMDPLPICRGRQIKVLSYFKRSVLLFISSVAQFCRPVERNILRSSSTWPLHWSVRGLPPVFFLTLWRQSFQI